MTQSDANRSSGANANPTTEVLDALMEQETRGRTGPAARRYVRKRWTVELQIRIEENVELGMISRDLGVTTQDLSRGGFSFLCRNYLHPGSHVQARVTTLPGSPVLMGTVVNCCYAGAGQHRVGVKFLVAPA